jgi:hypothetical protein
LAYSAKSFKNPKIQVIWDLGIENPATLGRKKRTCHVTPPPPSSDLGHAALRNSILCAGGGRALDMATTSPKRKCFLEHIKKGNIFLYIIANLAGNINNIETYCVNSDCIEGLATTMVRGRGEGVRRLTARSHLTWATRFNVTWGSDMTWKKGPWRLGLKHWNACHKQEEF